MIPFILLVTSFTTATVGVSKGTEGLSKINEAKEIVKKAKSKYEKAHKKLEKNVADFNKSLESVGKEKLKLHELRKRGVNILKRINNNTKLVNSFSQKEMINIQKDIEDLEENIHFTDEIIKGIFKVAKGAYLSYIGAIGIATTIGTASTGTAISALSGAAAENAILAWFGGGSLAAGGGGMALGSAVLSGIVVGPAIFFAGISLAKAGEKALTQATEFEGKVKKKIEEFKLIEKDIQDSMCYLNKYRKILKTYSKRIYTVSKHLDRLLKAIDTCQETEQTIVLENKVELLIALLKGSTEILKVNIIKNSFLVTRELIKKTQRHERKLQNLKII